MKKILLTLLFALTMGFGYSQTYDMDGTPVTTCSGNFYDENGSVGDYDKTDIEQTFTPGTAGSMLSFNFTSFGIANDGDYLKVYDGPTTASPLIDTYTFSNPPGLVTATNTGELTFEWFADNNGYGTGWEATISCVVSETCSDGIQNQDETGIDCGGATCPACPTCSDGIQNQDETGIDCGGVCTPCSAAGDILISDGGTVTGCSGTLYDSGGSGGDYGSNEDYIITLCSGSAEGVQLDFTEFDLEDGYEFLYVLDGGGIPIATYTGTTSPGVIQSTGTCMILQFTSDGGIVKPGFAANISCYTIAAPTCSDGIQNQGEAGIDCGGPCAACSFVTLNGATDGSTITGCTSTLYDSGGSSSNYGDGEDYYISFCSGTAENIKIDFTEFNTESGYDYVYIYDGPDTGSPQVTGSPFAGSTNPGPFYSSGTCLTIRFRSDGSNNSTGWTALISCSTPTCFDGILNQDETAIDCGGVCTACVETCSDGIMNQDETGIDCGGVCPECNTEVLISDGGTVTQCSGNFYDSGGNAGDYNWGEASEITICSGVDDRIQLDFTTFITNDGLDKLFIYDGANTSAPQIAGSPFTGSTSPGTIISTGTCLTFKFTSQFTTNDGFAATISCVEPTCSDGIQNGDEEGVDCGPSCPTKCGGEECAESDPFCTNVAYSFRTNIDNGSYAEAGPDYGCLCAQPNPVWYYMKAADAGDINIHISSTCGDVDFACWGPFSSVQCNSGSLSATGAPVCGSTPFNTVYGNLVDCSYSPASEEDCFIPNATIDDYYMFMVTNFDNCEGNINFQKTAGEGTCDCSIVTLPIELVSFNSVCTNDGIEINWTTASENDNLGFDLQKSLNGIDFETIEFIEGFGNSTQLNDYSFVDKSINNDVVYYRLKQIDYNGQFEYSNIIAERCNLNSLFDYNASYIKTYNQVNIMFTDQLVTSCNFELIDCLGHVIYKEKFPAGIINKRIILPTNIKGTYILNIYNDSTISRKKIICY